MEKDKKIEVINVIFLVVTIAYTIISFADSILNETSESLSYYLVRNLYLIGFIVVVIEKIMKKESKICSSIFLVTTIITAISAIIYNYSIIANPYFYSTFIKVYGIVQDIVKVLLVIMSSLYFVKKKNNVISYIFFISTIIYCGYSLLADFSIHCCFVIIVNMYIALYLLYANKGVTQKTFRNIIIVLIITILTILIYTFYSLELPKIKYNKAVAQLENIDQVNSSMIPTRSVNLKYKKGIINYEVSENIKKALENLYHYNENIDIFLSIEELDSKQINLLQTETKKFVVNGREFFMVTSTTNDGMVNYTKIKNNIYCAIYIAFHKKISLKEEDLQNIKPFFYLTIR